MKKIFKRLAVLATVLATSFALAPTSPAAASWNELTVGRVGFWSMSYGDPYNNGSFGAYRTPSEGAAYCHTLPSNLDDFRSMWNDSDWNVYLMKENCGGFDDGDWYAIVRPNQRVNTTLNTNWRNVQSFSYGNPR